MSTSVRTNGSAWAQILVENDKVSRFALPRTRLACKHPLREPAAALVCEVIAVCGTEASQSNSKNRWKRSRYFRDRNNRASQRTRGHSLLRRSRPAKAEHITQRRDDISMAAPKSGDLTDQSTSERL